MWYKSKTTWAVGIAQLTHHSVRGGGKNLSTSGLRIIAPHREPRGELIGQYRPPISFAHRKAKNVITYPLLSSVNSPPPSAAYIRQ